MDAVRRKRAEKTVVREVKIKVDKFPVIAYSNKEQIHIIKAKSEKSIFFSCIREKLPPAASSFCNKKGEVHS